MDAVRRLQHLDAPADTPFSVDHLPALLGSHPRAKPDVSGTLDVAGLVRVMHGPNPRFTKR
jgi:hypothetical protein